MAWIDHINVVILHGEQSGKRIKKTLQWLNKHWLCLLVFLMERFQRFEELPKVVDVEEKPKPIEYEVKECECEFVNIFRIHLLIFALISIETE